MHKRTVTFPLRTARHARLDYPVMPGMTFLNLDPYSEDYDLCIVTCAMVEYYDD